MEGFGLLIGHLIGDYIIQNDYLALNKTKNSLICLLHCLLYTLAVWLCACWWMPWWGLVVCFATHFPISFSFGGSLDEECLGPVPVRDRPALALVDHTR